MLIDIDVQDACRLLQLLQRNETYSAGGPVLAATGVWPLQQVASELTALVGKWEASLAAALACSSCCQLAGPRRRHRWPCRQTGWL